MAWHSVWGQTNVSNNDVKFMLADLAASIQERYKLLHQEQCEFITESSSTDTDAISNDFKEATIQYVKTMLQRMIGNVEEMVTGSGNRFYKESACTNIYTSLENLIDETAMMDYVDWIEMPWRDSYFWETFQAAIKKLRYIKIHITVTDGATSVETGDVDIANGVDGLSPQDSWDSLTETGTGTGSLIYYSMEGVPGSGVPAYYLGNCLSPVFWGWENMQPKRIQSSAFSWEPTGTITYDYVEDSITKVELIITASSSSMVIYVGSGDPAYGSGWGGMPDISFTVAGSTLDIPACDDNTGADATYTIDVGTLEGESIIEMDDLSTIPGYPNPCGSLELRWGFSGGAGISPNAYAFFDCNPQYNYPA